MRDTRSTAFHEGLFTFGPCPGPKAADEGSFFCLGMGTERMDPLDPFGDSVILCYPCFSHREGLIIQRNVMEVLSA